MQCLNPTGNGFYYLMVIAIDFILVDTLFEYHLYGYLSTDNGFHCVMVIPIDFKLVDTMFEFHLCGYFSTVMDSIV